jgi:hypothetical protein
MKTFKEFWKSANDNERIYRELYEFVHSFQPKSNSDQRLLSQVSGELSTYATIGEFSRGLARTYNEAMSKK